MTQHRPSGITVMGIYSNSLPEDLGAEYDLFSPLGLLGIKFGTQPTEDVLNAATEAASTALRMKLTTQVVGDTYYVMPVPPAGTVVQ
jgi:hypothetical protein